MRDVNFFEPYIEKSDFRIDKKLVFFIVSTFTILSLTTYIIYNSILIKHESRLVNELISTVENPRTVKKVEEIKEKEIQVNEYRNSVDKIKQLDKSIEKRDIINEEFIDSITSKMPEDLFFTSLSIHNDIQIVGISKDKWAVAELEKGLEELEDVEEVFVSNILSNGDNYNFTINITLKDVMEDGEETSQGEN